MTTHLIDNISLMKSEVEILRDRLNDIDKRLSNLEASGEPITVRKAVRILEAHICLEAVGGSKYKFRKGNYNIDAISKTADPVVTAQLSRILSTRGLSTDHLTMIAYLRDCADFGGHANMPAMSKVEWIEALTSDDVTEASEADERNDEEEKQRALTAVRIKTDLLSALEAYNPCPPGGGVWEIKHPVYKPTKVPVQTEKAFAM